MMSFLCMIEYATIPKLFCDFQITLALLLGSDYSQGVYGMGRVGFDSFFACRIAFYTYNPIAACNCVYAVLVPFVGICLSDC